MPTAFIRLGLIIFALGFFSHFLFHDYLLPGLICGLGFVIFIVGVVLWSLENNGDISLS